MELKNENNEPYSVFENNQIWAENINFLLQVMTQNYLYKNSEFL